MGMCVPTDDYKSMKQFIINIGEYLMAKVKSKKVVEYIWKLTEDEVGAIQKAMMSSDYYHSDSLSDQGLDAKDQADLVSLFRTRFSYRPTSKPLQRYKTLVGLTTLGQVQNAVTQMGDMTWSVYENGFASTLKAAFPS